MAGTHIGGVKAAQTNKVRYGDDFYAIIGAVGGHTHSDLPRGFAAMSPEMRSEIGRKGGRNSWKNRTRISRNSFEYSVGSIKPLNRRKHWWSKRVLVDE